LDASTEFGAGINLKLTYLVLVCLFVSTFSFAQSAAKPEATDVSESAQAPATGTVPNPEQTPPPDKPSAGQPAQPADQSPSQAKDKNKDNQGAKDAANGTSGTSKDRLFFALPNFLTVENAGQIPPMTTGQKYKVITRSSFDPVQFAWYGFLSGISQAENSEPGFGQGAAGYGKRYGSYLADGTIENFLVGAVFPSALHQDPRFFQSGQGSFFHRTGYALSRAVVTRTDSGHSQFNYSEVFGSALASAISTYSYHPHPGFHPGQTTPYVASDRTLKNTASVWGTQVGYDTITFVVKEFWPDIRRKLKKQPH
jgi:hypothetical protein